MKFKLIALILSLIFNITMEAQDPLRFSDAIKGFVELSIDEEEEIIVFTGSSSIRFWEDLAIDCNESKVVNTGFGGSQMSDLLYFVDQTILRFNPSEVYIYEGDNDIAFGKKPADIMETTRQLVKKTLDLNAELKINFISAKPSPSRWEYKAEYEAFNNLLKDYCDEHSQLSYIDVWNPMLDSNGHPSPDIFISDSLHMNRKGYLLWKEVMCKE